VLPPARGAALLARVAHLYQEDADPGLHAAAEWLLRQWKQGRAVKEVVEHWSADERRAEQLRRIRQELGEGPRWYVNGQGQTMVVVPADATFSMGSPDNEAGRNAQAEPLHRVRIPRPFAIAAKEVTVEQFLRFLPEHRYVVKYSPRPDGPMINVTWYEAAEYCNRLSEQEGIPREEWCYLRNGAGQHDDGMRLAPGYLSRRGYRLPTEAEWEYACRAGTVTRRYYGDADELLPKYAWYSKTTNEEGVRPGGLLKPNDLGLFDLYGNVAEWTQDPGFAYPLPGRNRERLDEECRLLSVRNEPRLFRGGSFAHLASFLRSANRQTNQPSISEVGLGFRVAKTWP
jgi:formylglycine-generating enzyme required for sulfatase activity